VVQQGQHLDADQLALKKTLFIRLISLFVIDILQIHS
jgi:hypothetical protein